MAVKVLLIIFIGFAGGLAVGAGFVAFLAVLGIIPRVTQLTKTARYIHLYEWGVILGAFAGGWSSLRDTMLYVSKFLLIPIGLACGIFVGMLAAALTEVLNVLPILAKRIGLDKKIVILVMAIVFGKIAGSLFHWIYYVDL
ncbi:stage V sporulation protein AB [Bacillus luteolus]|uniref:Stage V sporulation protein AB n=1 Tax=Litchfieldia luteola TaxID=682179 RepID=A0ABR9QPC3_9BACI|nr:stage V sporulation protein AB [Cytobacillus luteolus]MBE4910361.1 stage V sporulation protein AB [Cytobacillus luteolus]MBP1942064.1 stage V sporulation protein AB [Cytobacillus luteolus]